jgi:Na+(H+)/acetate symporter ActP
MLGNKHQFMWKFKIKHMKETLKKVFHKSVLAVVGVLFGIGIVFEYIVFPGLTTADSYTNILAALIGIFSVLFVYHFIQWEDLFKFILDKNETIPPGETEYDYIPKDKIVKKKRNPKQFDGVKSEEPFVKTRKKTK